MKLGIRLRSAWIPEPSFFSLHCKPDQKTEGQKKKTELTYRAVGKEWSVDKGLEHWEPKGGTPVNSIFIHAQYPPIFHYRKLASQLELPSVSWIASERTHPRKGRSSAAHFPELQSLGVQERWAFWVVWIIPPQPFTFPLSFHTHQTCTEV